MARAHSGSDFAADFHCSTAGTLAEVLARDDVDGVVITAPNDQHAPLIEAAAAAGKHVYTEKPAAVQINDLRRIQRAVTIAGIVFSCGHSARRLAGLREMKRVIESGEAGSVSMAEAVFGNDRGLEIKPGDWRADPAETPGGPLTQLGIHQINNLQYLLGPVRRTMALGRASVTRWRRVESAGRRFSPASTSCGDVDFAAFIAHEAELGGITLESGHAEVSDGLDPEEP